MQLKKLNSKFLVLTFLLFLSSAFVFIEPAPYDLGIILLLIAGVLFSKLHFNISNIHMILIPIFIFVFGNLTSMFGMRDTVTGLRYFAITFYLILSYFLVIGIIGKYGDKATKIILNGYAIGAIVTALLASLAYLHIIPGYELFTRWDRVRGLFKDPNVFAPFLIPIALYAYYNIEQPNKQKKIWWFVVLIVVTIGVFLSYSRAAWGNYILVFSIYFVLRFILKPTAKFLKRIILISLVIICAIAYVLSIPSINTMVVQRFSYQGYDNDRFGNQAVALELGMEYPFGIGPGQYEDSIGYATHSSYLRTWSENGFLGFIGFMSFMVVSLFRSLRIVFVSKNPFFIIFFASIVGLMFNSIVVDTVHWRHFWIIFAIPWAYTYKESAKVMIEPITEKIKKRRKIKIVW